MLVCALQEAALSLGGAGPGQLSSNQDSPTGFATPDMGLVLSDTQVSFSKEELDKMTSEWPFSASKLKKRVI